MKILRPDSPSLCSQDQDGTLSSQRGLLYQGTATAPVTTPYDPSFDGAFYQVSHRIINLLAGLCRYLSCLLSLFGCRTLLSLFTSALSLCSGRALCLVENCVVSSVGRFVSLVFSISSLSVLSLHSRVIVVRPCCFRLDCKC